MGISRNLVGISRNLVLIAEFCGNLTESHLLYKKAKTLSLNKILQENFSENFINSGMQNEADSQNFRFI